MSLDIKIVEKEIGFTLEIEELVSMMKMPKTMDNDFKKLINYINSKNIKSSKYVKALHRGAYYEVGKHIKQCING